MLDYRDVNKQYDSIVSIEMIEAVGEKYLNEYFKSIKKKLNTQRTSGHTINSYK